MREYKDAAQYMVVVIVPDVLEGMLKHFLFLDNVYYFKAFQFHISDSYEFRIDAEGFTIATDAVLKGQVDILIFFLNIIHLDYLLFLVLDYDEVFHHEGE